MRNFVITIGRQFGSGGRALGKILSQKLGIPFYDKELLLQAAKESGLNPELFESNDERKPQFISNALSYSFGMSPMPWYGGGSSITADSLYRAQTEFIEQIASKGPCIIVGRSSDYVLRNHPNVVNVFLHADIDSCVRRIMERKECDSPEKARKLAERTNKLRANFYNFYTDKRWGDAASYDLCFNTARLPLERIATVILAYLDNLATQD